MKNANANINNTLTYIFKHEQQSKKSRTQHEKNIRIDYRGF